MAKRDYYDILGVNKSSSKEEIKKAYRMISLVMLLFKLVVVKDLVDLTLHLFQIFLRIFLEIFQEVLLEDQAEDQLAIGVMT